MATDRGGRDKLRKVEAVLADRAATDGEKAAAEAAASRIRRKRAEDSRAALAANPGLMYALGRVFRRARGGESATADPSVMYSLGRAWRKMIGKR
jgi:hypothetical protein